MITTTWWRPLKGDPMGWLLDYDNPAVRYWTLTNVLDRQPDIPVVREARSILATNPIVQRVFARQQHDSGWGSPATPDQPTWQATADHLALLVELGAPGHDERIATAADWALDQAADADGDFDLPGHFLWALLRLGYAEDPRVRRAVRRAAKYLVERGSPGALIDRSAWDKLPLLWALLQLPQGERNRGTEAAIQTALAELEHTEWAALEPERLELSFPHIGAPDLGLALRTLAQAGRVQEERSIPAVARLVELQGTRGRWPLHHNHADRLLAPLEPVTEESKWSTLNALRILRATEPDE